MADIENEDIFRKQEEVMRLGIRLRHGGEVRGQKVPKTMIRLLL